MVTSIVYDDIYTVAICKNHYIQMNIYKQVIPGIDEIKAANKRKNKTASNSKQVEYKIELVNTNFTAQLDQILIKEKFDVDLSKFRITHATSYINKAVRYLILSDNDGNIISFKKGLEFKNMFRVLKGPITALQRHTITLLMTSDRSVGFVKMFEEKTDDLVCLGGDRYIGIMNDNSQSGILYAQTRDG